MPQGMRFIPSANILMKERVSYSVALRKSHARDNNMKTAFIPGVGSSAFLPTMKSVLLVGKAVLISQQSLRSLIVCCVREPSPMGRGSLRGFRTRRQALDVHK